MRGGAKAALFLGVMAMIFLVGFYTYGELSNDEEGLRIGLITAAMLLVLSLISWIKVRLWK